MCLPRKSDLDVILEWFTHKYPNISYEKFERSIVVYTTDSYERFIAFKGLQEAGFSQFEISCTMLIAYFDHEKSLNYVEII